jgi:hypothetical protein
MIPRTFEAGIKWKDENLSYIPAQMLSVTCAVGEYDENDPDHEAIDPSVFFWFDQKDVKDGKIENLVGFEDHDFVIVDVDLLSDSELVKEVA